MVPYWGAQLGGATVAAVALRLATGAGPLGVTRPVGSDVRAFGLEIVLTFILMLVIAAVATGPRAAPAAAGLAIGGAVALGSLVGGPVSGGSMNPARSLAPALVSGDLVGIWVYLSAPFVGAIAAALVYSWLVRELPGAASATPDP